jgi:hypothetical protein
MLQYKEKKYFWKSECFLRCLPTQVAKVPEKHKNTKKNLILTRYYDTFIMTIDEYECVERKGGSEPTTGPTGH